MNQYSRRPDASDDPILEVGGYVEDLPQNTEANRRSARRGADLARTAIGAAVKNPIESKVEFLSDDAKKISGLITNSDLDAPQVKARIRSMIDMALQKNEITTQEANGLAHYLDHAEGLSDDLGRTPDVFELQAGAK
jgi:hypothetical protein